MRPHPPKTLACFLWPDSSVATLSRVLEMWGWSVADEQRELSWDSAFKELSRPCQGVSWGRMASDGWQLIFSRPSDWHNYCRFELGFPLIAFFWSRNGDGVLEMLRANDGAEILFPVDEQRVPNGISIIGRELQAPAVGGHTRDGPTLLYRLRLASERVNIYPLPMEFSVWDRLEETFKELGVPQTVWPCPRCLPSIVRCSNGDE